MSGMIKFGTDGWRGIIGKDFNLDNVAVVAQAIADYLRLKVKGKRLKGKATRLKVAVGYDTRRLSPESAREISQVLAGNRIKVVLSHKPLPTQAVSYAVKSGGFSLGIMVTASHNPARFNGIKIKSSFGGAAQSRLTNQIERLIFRHPPNKLSLQQARRLHLFKKTNLISNYLKFLQSYLDRPLLKKGRLKILVDSMHGTADSYIALMLQDTPCKVTTIHKNFDYSFGGIKPEPIQQCLRQAASLIRTRGLDAGLANDGDADRVAALDGQGRFISPQEIISLLLLYLIRQRKLKGAVVKTISGTTLLDEIAKKYKLRIYETPIGFKHIARLMRGKDVLIGGEEAGGIGFKNYLLERDGILAGLLLLEAMIAQKKPLEALLAEMHQEFGRYFYLRKDLRCLADDKEKVRVQLKQLKTGKYFSRLKINRIKDYDGLKLCLADGSWILFRLSGTEPLVRIYAESDSLTKTRRLIAEGARILNG